MSEPTDFLDHCLTVFAVWVLFVGCRYLSLKHFIVNLFRRMGFSCCDSLIRGEETTRDGNERNVIEYRQLSDERKNEIDCNRSASILGYLNGFSLTLKREHMVKCLSDSESQLAVQGDKENGIKRIQQSSSSVEAIDAQYIQEQKSNNDIPQSTSLHLTPRSLQQKQSELTVDETGSARDIQMQESSQYNIDSTVIFDKAAAEDKSMNYTHLGIPLPGHDLNGRTIQQVYSVENQKDAASDTPQKKRLNFVGGRKTAQESATGVIRPKEKEQVALSVKVRHVPLSCAICLTDYEESERICWASNPECTHVFHEDCIVQWLVTSGRNHAVSLDPNETDFLDYKLECPCCRQEFILKPETTQGLGENAV